MNDIMKMHYFKTLDIPFFLDYTIQLRHSQRTHTHSYERTYTNLTPMSIFEDF